MAKKSSTVLSLCGGLGLCSLLLLGLLIIFYCLIQINESFYSAPTLKISVKNQHYEALTRLDEYMKKNVTSEERDNFIKDANRLIYEYKTKKMSNRKFYRSIFEEVFYNFYDTQYNKKDMDRVREIIWRKGAGHLNSNMSKEKKIKIKKDIYSWIPSS